MGHSIGWANGYSRVCVAARRRSNFRAKFDSYCIKQLLLHTLALIPNPSPEGEGSKIQSPSPLGRGI
jgi:hypothetical protein